MGVEQHSLKNKRVYEKWQHCLEGFFNVREGYAVFTADIALRYGFARNSMQKLQEMIFKKALKKLNSWGAAQLKKWGNDTFQVGYISKSYSEVKQVFGQQWKITYDCFWE